MYRFPLTVNTLIYSIYILHAIRSDFTTSNSYRVTILAEENMLLREFCRKDSFQDLLGPSRNI